MSVYVNLSVPVDVSSVCTVQYLQSVCSPNLKMWAFLGKDNNYARRAFLLYDGVHYDPIYMETNGRMKTIFPRSDEDIKIRALALASEFKEVSW